MEYTLFYLTKELPVYFHVDTAGLWFFAAETLLWAAVFCFCPAYLKKKENKGRFYLFFFLVYGCMQGLNFAGNMFTFYLFYELMTLLSLPLVLHEQTKEAVMAGLKYLFYSVFGACMVLFGLFALFSCTGSLTFVGGGIVGMLSGSENEVLLLWAAFCMILGFSVKAGMFPFHGWLPTAHSIAPAPASAVLSAGIVKAGVLGIIRTVYYLVGPGNLQGTWVQRVWLILALITIFMGSVLAYREKQLKKRLAYSTVSQVSYILFGLAVMNGQAFTGALLHTVGHVFMKGSLFLFAGAVITQTGKTGAEELKGIGREMPLTLWGFTIAALGLIGIPPAAGFLSKWYLAEGALDSGLSVFSWLGSVILLVSAVYTAGYLLPISMRGFLPGEETKVRGKKEPSWQMLFPILLLVLFSLMMGIFPGSMLNGIEEITSVIF